MRMKSEFVKYLKSIGMTKPLLERIEIIYGFFEEICPDEITDMFINERTKAGERTYESLWLFSERYVMEAKQFIRDIDDFDITPIKGRVKYCNIKKTKYDFATATQESKAYVRVELDTGIVGELRASQGNCDNLGNIIRKYILVNLKQ